ncbi:MAG: sulfite exporter TauE/SafE family protein [Rhodospirillaceae bacterium]
MDAPAAILLLETGFDHCRVAVDQQGGLITSLFFAGLTGSAGHCAAMCGPFVLAQVAARLEALPAAKLSEGRRLCGALLLSYHLGRAGTYMALGALAGWLVGRFGALSGVRWLSAGLLAAAALGFLAAAGVRLWGRRGGAAGTAAGSLLVLLARPLWGGAGPVGCRGFALGLILGFLPCGLLYSALAVAAATRDPLAGALGLLAFAAGTVPALVAVGLAGHAAGHRWRDSLARAAPAILIANAGFLGWLAWRLAAG